MLAALVLANAGCGSAEPPHSEYFVVFFQPSSAQLLPEGRLALDEAIRDAKRGEPREISVKGYVRADGGERELSEQRMRVVEEALTAGGLSTRIVRLAPETVDAQSFARLGNGVVVQVARGALPQPATPQAPGQS
ncbi:MAG TPA: OmpA family protein [Stellaceae bacterium]|nr:OmpA family protein [Stellaceae bacterium]